MGQFLNKDRVTLIDKTLTPGSSAGVRPQSSAEVLGGLEPRPNGLYAYAYALLIALSFTATPGQGASDLAAKKIWAALKEVSIHYANTIKRCTKLSGLNILRLGVQADELYSPDLISSAIPVTSLKANAGAQAVTMNILYPLAIKYIVNGDGKHTGLIPLSALKKAADIQVTILGSATIDTLWTIGDVGLKVDLMTCETRDPLPHVAVYEVFQDYSTARATLPGAGDRLYSAILGTDDDDGDLTLPTSFVVVADGKTIRNLVSGDDLVQEENLSRQDGINDVMPVVCPVLTLSGRRLDEALVVKDSITLENMNENHSGSYGVLVRYSQDLDANTQRQMLMEHRVPSELIDAYIAQQRARSAEQTDLEIGRVTTFLRAV